MVTVITFRWAAPYLGRRKQARMSRRDYSFVGSWRAMSFALSQTRIARERRSATKSPTYTMYQSVQSTLRALGFTRVELFAGLYILGCANGLAARMILSVHRLGWADDAVGTFDVSAIVVLRASPAYRWFWPTRQVAYIWPTSRSRWLSY